MDKSLDKISPKSRSSGSLINIKEGTFILYGGSSREESFNDFWLLELIESDSKLTFDWKNIKYKEEENNDNNNKTFLTERYGCAVGVYENKIFLHGGQNIQQIIFPDLYSVKFSIEERIISSVKNLTKYPIDFKTTPNQRNSHLYYQYNDLLIIYGGGNNDGLLNDSFVYDLKSDSGKWKKIPLKPSCEIEMGGLCYYNNKLYVIGGRNHEDINDYFLIYEYDIRNYDQTKEITYIKQKLPMKLCSFGYCLYEKWIILYGGLNGEAFLNTILLFNLELSKWFYYKKSSNLNIYGSICPMIAHDNKYLIIFGGSNIQYESNQTVVIELKDVINEENLKEFN